MDPDPNAEDHLLVFVTAPDLETARALGKRAVEQRLAACANLVPGLESHYWWQGALQTDHEILILFKTPRSHFDRLRDAILAGHPYSCPEIVAVPLVRGHAPYLEWIRSSTL